MCLDMKHKDFLQRRIKSKRIDMSLYPDENTAADVLRSMRNQAIISYRSIFKIQK